MTSTPPTESPEFLGPLRDQLVRGAAAHRRRRRRRAAALGSAAVALAVVVGVMAVVAERDEVQLRTAPDPATSAAGGADDPSAPATVARDGLDASRWSPAATGLAGASDMAVFWTGDRVLVLNTENGGGDVAGEIWDPATNTVTPMAPSGIPWRVGASTVWTGEELLVFGGGSDSAIDPLGAAYRPSTDSWRRLPDPPLPVNALIGTLGGPALWTGSEMVVYGSGYAYTPADDSWRRTNAWWTSGLSPRTRPLTAASGSRAVVWGGCFVEGVQCDETNEGLLGDGAVYDVVTDSWALLPPGPLVPAVHAVGVWVGDEVVITVTEPGVGATGARTAAWSATTGAWRVLPDPPLSDRRFAAATWTGREVVVWGGTTGDGDGAALDPATGTWRPIEPSPVAPGRILHTMVWAGDRVYISSTLHVPTPVTLRLDVDAEAPVEAPPVEGPPVEGPAVPVGPGVTFPGDQPASPSDLVIGTGYDVDVDLDCESFVLGGTWVLEEGDPRSWQAPPERHEGGTFTLDAPDHGTFVGDAGRTKVATFRLLPPWADPACRHQPR